MSTNELADLKQFFTELLDTKLEEKLDAKLEAKFAQQTAELQQYVQAAVDSAAHSFRQEMNQRFEAVMAAIGDTLVVANDYFDGRVSNHERRISWLERATA